MQNILDGVLKAISQYITLTYIIPIGAPIVTACLGYSQRVPWMYVWLGVVATFAFATHGILRFDEWRARRLVEDKLAFQTVRVGRSINGEGMFIGVQIKSLAAFPLEFQINEIRTKLNYKVPRETGFELTKFNIPENGSGWFDDHPIRIDDIPKPGTIEGFIEYKINYGRKGALRYCLAGKKQVVVAFNDDGLLSHYSWNDAS
ncbi:MAG: hypothetical protein WCJ64_26965 [Rhodospirillaceae bacterium]